MASAMPKAKAEKQAMGPFRVCPPVDYPAYLDFLDRCNHNFIRLWVWELASWNPWAKTQLSADPVPFLRTGPGSALDGKPKFDVTRSTISTTCCGKYRTKAILTSWIGSIT